MPPDDPARSGLTPAPAACSGAQGTPGGASASQLERDAVLEMIASAQAAAAAQAGPNGLAATDQREALTLGQLVRLAARPRLRWEMERYPVRPSADVRCLPRRCGSSPGCGGRARG